ncbi:PRC-barrel domain-containing protein [Roseibium aestuarii]|uniref:PRC-barrel domain-containing protein n=1 Tax=Roseibium aestuarii TaxID=2600299 RepID=A0ABW4JT96_9HYPH|nr:PRC-barrel domain-containing protein [Roseibium aestuarii]
MSDTTAHDCDAGLLAARVLLFAGCVVFALLAAFPNLHAFGAEVQTIAPATKSVTREPMEPTGNGQTTAAVAVPEELIGEPVLSLEGETLGDVAAVQVDDNGLLVSLDAELGGFFGIGAKMLRFPVKDFAVNAHGVILGLSSDEVETLLD